MSFYWCALLMLVGACFSSHLSGVTAQSSEDLSTVGIVIAPQDTSAKPGSNVLLPCVAGSDKEGLTITWMKGDKPLVKDANKVIIHDLAAMIKGGMFFVKSVLEICGLEEADIGNYSCTASGGDGGKNDTATFEIVAHKVPVQIIEAPRDENLTNSDVQMLWKCVAIGFPLPTITWIWNGVPVTSDWNNHTIQNNVYTQGEVEFVQSTLELWIDDLAIGEYKCVVTNTHSIASASYNILTNVYPRILTPPVDTVIQIGQSHNITCDAHGYPPPNISWKMNGAPINTNGHMYVHPQTSVRSGGVEFVRRVLEVHHTKPALEGQYECVATNPQNIDSATFQISTQVLEIVIAPTNVKLLHSRDMVSLSCVAYGHPPPSIRWTRNIKGTSGDLMSDNGVTNTYEQTEERGEATLSKSVLEICNAKEVDSGQYSCVADNGITVKTSRFDICVNSPVGIALAPSDTDVTVGTTVFLPCVAYSHSGPPQVTWTVGDSTITTSNTSRMRVYENETEQRNGMVVLRSVLALGCAELEDTNVYGCHISNGHERKAATFNVQVNLPEATTSDTTTLGSTTTVETTSQRTNTGPGGLSTASTITAGIGHASYIGGLIGIFFVLPIAVIYLAFKKLRQSLNTSIPLVNLCFGLIALKISYLASYYSAVPGSSKVSCEVFAAVFQYFFLVAMAAMANMVFLTLTPPTLKIYIPALCLNWGLPLLVVVISVTPNIPSYTNGELCYATQWTLWFGIVLPFVLTHLIAWIILILSAICCPLKKKEEQTPKPRRFQTTIKVLFLLFLFEFNWGVGLPAMYVSGTAQVVLKALFLVASITLGLFIFLFFGVFSRDVIQELTSLFKPRAQVEQRQPNSSDGDDATYDSVSDIHFEFPKQAEVPNLPPPSIAVQQEHMYSDSPRLMRLGSLTASIGEELPLRSPGATTQKVKLTDITNNKPIIAKEGNKPGVQSEQPCLETSAAARPQCKDFEKTGNSY